ncbi:hypothetical protein [Plantibacter sp. LMC-P-059a]|uniref:hypothetical protein n=1 Tax=Plantibacter sp. LMC-P-059a TaxID=3040297 RepID=UPI00254F1DDE|nr:hypothetical protein [Plantibacter sp. LMC-P-059a]
MGSPTRVVRQPAVLAVLGLTALYIGFILLLVATCDGGCQESYPMHCLFLELDLPGLLVTVLLLVAVAVAAGICSTRRRSVARGALLVALGVGVVAIMVVGVELSSNLAREWRY